MKSSVTGLAILGGLLVIGGAAGLFAYQSQQAKSVREIAVYKTPT